MALTTGLDAYWDFDTHVRNEDIEDRVTPGSVDLTSAEATNKYPHPVPGLRGQAREFDGAEGLYLSHADAAALSISSGDDFTLVFWVMFQDVPSSRSNSYEPGHDPLKATIRKGGPNHFAEEWRVDVRMHGWRHWHVNFNIRESAASNADWARSGMSMMWRPGVSNIPALHTACWHMVACRYDQSRLDTNIRVYQGVSSLTGQPLAGSARWDWPGNRYAPLLKLYVDSSIEDGRGVYENRKSSGFTGALDAGNDFRIGAPPFTYSTQRDKSDFTIDSVGIWSRYLTNQDLETLWNGGYGLDYPLLPPWTDIYAPKPTPIFLPTPHSLYHGHGWNVGEIPESSPAPNGWNHTQPTLPAWRVPPRIPGWSYGNNLPQVAPEPVVSQWWIQASEPVKTDPRIEHLSPGPVEVAPKAGGEEPIIPTPPTPPAPPVDNSEAAVTDEGYRPGRADIDQSRYGTS